MKRFWALRLLLAFVGSSASADLESVFVSPPADTRPWCYWYWISDNISREGITRDLEAMRRVGIGEALIGNIYMEDARKGTVQALSEEWWSMVEHAIREGGRLGVDIGMFNCPGWSQSGGPWVKPTEAMRYLAARKTQVKGPVRLSSPLQGTTNHFQRVSVISFRISPDSQTNRPVRISTSPEWATAHALVDGDETTTSKIVGNKDGTLTIELAFAQAIEARSLRIVPGKTDFAMQCRLEAARPGARDRLLNKEVTEKDRETTATDSEEWELVETFAVDRSNNSIGVGFIPHAPVVVSFGAVAADRFRVVISGVRGDAEVAEVEISGEAKLERYIEKQLGKMHPTPLPLWDAYLWPPAEEPELPGLSVQPSEVIDLTSKVSVEGVLNWDVPTGDWMILDVGMALTGTKNSPASPQGQGLEIDKMSRSAAQAHFDAYIGEILRRMPRADRKAFKHVVADSYEMGSQNWTDGFRDTFKKRYGYDPQPWLPTLAGRVVSSATESDRFLWDLRRLVADQVSYEYVGGLREACNKHGLQLWLENYGHWGFPGEFLQYGGQSDQVGGEFWATGDLGSIELRAASSAAHIYGKPRVSAEAFTSTEKFTSTPASLRKRGDWALTEGINHWVLHVYILQPWEEKQPGVNAWFSTEFNRHNTWFEQSKSFIDYYRRCHALLQQGQHVADVAYFIGEDTPKMTGQRQPQLPAGYDYDYINAEVIRTRLSVRSGRWVLPDGKSYAVLVLPPQETMRPELLERIGELVMKGGRLMGEPPNRSPSLQDFPRADERVRALAGRIWQRSGSGKGVAFVKGHVFQGTNMAGVLAELGCGPDVSGVDPQRVLWTHRRSGKAEVYFISNQTEQRLAIAPEFRVPDLAPEIWDPVDGSLAAAGVFERKGNRTAVALNLEPAASQFVVFRKRRDPGPSVVSVRHGQTPVLSTMRTADSSSPPAGRQTSNSFSITAWVRPAAGIPLPKGANEGVFIPSPRNDLVTPAHGDSHFPGGEHAFAGLSVGVNGVVVYEHSGNYYAPILSYKGLIEGWTHVAVIYRNRQPVLYLNGKEVAQGLRSRFHVHPGTSVEPGGSLNYKGAFRDLRDYDHSLSASMIASLAEKRPEEDAGPFAVSFETSTGRRPVLSASKPGVFKLSYSDGAEQVFNAAPRPPITFEGPWHINLLFGGAEPAFVLEELKSLSEHTNEVVKYFAGTVAYRRKFELPSMSKATRVLLDLGEVNGMVEVRLGGKTLATLWATPFLVDITEEARKGSNELELLVTGTWRNRLIGHAKYPNGIPGSPETTTPFLSTDIKIRPDEALQSQGLLGPVRLVFSERLSEAR